MLMIKKRYPKRKRIIYGGTAFVGSFALAVTLLASNHANLHHILANTPWQQKQVLEVATSDDQPADTQSTTAEESTPPVDQEETQTGATWSTPPQSTQTSPQQTNAPKPSAPANTQSPPATTETDESTPTADPAPDETEEEPVVDDSGIVEAVVDLLVPTPIEP